MKLSFSTLGCPDFSWSDITSLAKDFGFHGIELRGLGNDIFALNAPFSKENLAKTKANLKRLKLEICCLSSGCALKYKDKHEESIAELKEYMYYFQFTLTSYGKDIEANVPNKNDIMIPAFRELSNKIGAERVIWRYDPIFLTKVYCRLSREIL